MKITIWFEGNKHSETYKNYERVHFSGNALALINGNNRIEITGISGFEVRE